MRQRKRKKRKRNFIIMKNPQRMLIFFSSFLTKETKLFKIHNVSKR